MRHEKQLIPLKFAPGTGIAVAELHEIDGPLELGSPLGTLDLL
jgi:hypothetical protein